MIINYFFLAFITIINFVYYLSPADNPDINSPIIIMIIISGRSPAHWYAYQLKL